jgi:hypothetical protein
METEMKNAIAAIVSGCAILGLGMGAVGAASADTHSISLSKGVKLCKAELSKLQPALKSFIADYKDSTSSVQHFSIEFNATNAEGRLDKFTCVVDRKAETAMVALKKRRSSDFPAPEYAGMQKLASNN